jgi:hypothetical protein
MANLDALLHLRGTLQGAFGGKGDPGMLATAAATPGAPVAAPPVGPPVLGANPLDPWRPDAPWAQRNPLWKAADPALDHGARLVQQRRARELAVGARPAEAAPDVSDFLVERHLWGEGLSPDALRKECANVARATHSRLRAQFEAADSVGPKLEAQQAALRLLHPAVAHDVAGRESIHLPVGEPSPLVGRTGVGDETGLFYWLGTGGGEHAWRNPVASRAVKLTKGGRPDWDYGGPEGARLFDKTNGDRVQLYETQAGAADQWLQVELMQEDRLFIPTHYKLRASDRGDLAPRDWELQGSVDGDAWTVLRKHAGDTSLAARACKTWELTATGAFRFF